MNASMNELMQRMRSKNAALSMMGLIRRGANGECLRRGVGTGITVTDYLKGRLDLSIEAAKDPANGIALAALHSRAYRGDQEARMELHGLRIAILNNYVLPTLNFGRMFEIVELADNESPYIQNNTKQEIRAKYIGQDGMPELTKIIKPQAELAIDLHRLMSEEVEYTIRDIYTGNVEAAAQATFDIGFDVKNQLEGKLYTLLTGNVNSWNKNSGAYGAFDITNADRSKRTYVQNSRIRAGVLPTTNKLSVPGVSSSTVFDEATLKVIIRYAALWAGAYKDGDLRPTGEIIVPAGDIDQILTGITITNARQNDAAQQLLTSGYYSIDLLGITWKFIPDNTIPPGTCYPLFNKPVGQLFLKPSQNDQGETVDNRKNKATRWQSMVVGMVIGEPSRVNTASVKYNTN